jgi:hypothetical protein
MALKSEDRNQKAEIANQNSEVRIQKAEIRRRKSGGWGEAGTATASERSGEGQDRLKVKRLKVER